MLIECCWCNAKVYGKKKAEHLYCDAIGDTHIYYFLVCPSCHQPLVGLSVRDVYLEMENDTYGQYYNEPEREVKRLWPQAEQEFEGVVPKLVHTSLDEARKCYQAGSYLGCAVMCGRALEAISKEKTGEATLAKGLFKLREANVIDDRLFEWGEALRKERNIGAHAGEEVITGKDAGDILDFANAIVNYIYVLSWKFESYKKRKTKSS